jgi:hypothetical protein
MKKVTVELTPFELSLLTALYGESTKSKRENDFRNTIKHWSDSEHHNHCNELYNRLKRIVDSIEPEVDESDIGKMVYIRDLDSHPWEARKLVAILPSNIKNRYVALNVSCPDRVCTWNQAKKKLD